MTWNLHSITVFRFTMFNISNLVQKRVHSFKISFAEEFGQKDIENAYNRESDPEAKLIPKIKQTGPLIMCCRKLNVLMYYTLF